MDALEHRVTSSISSRWPLLMLRGLAAIAFGILTWVNPGLSLKALILLFGIFAFVDGIITLIAGLGGPATGGLRAFLVLAGIVGIAVGALTFFRPNITAMVLLVYMAFWAILHGVMEIAEAIRIRKEVTGEWRLALAGAFSVLFGALLLARPGAGALAVLWLIGLYAVAFGVLLVMLALRVKKLGRGTTIHEDQDQHTRRRAA